MFISDRVKRYAGGEWCRHCCPKFEKQTNKKIRSMFKRIQKESMEDMYSK